MYITITTNASTQTAEVANTESGLYEEIGKHLLNKIAARWPAKAVAQFFFL